MASSSDFDDALESLRKAAGLFDDKVSMVMREDRTATPQDLLNMQEASILVTAEVTQLFMQAHSLVQAERQIQVLQRIARALEMANRG